MIADHGRLLEEMERLLHELEGAKDAATREKARAVVRALLDVHGAGLGRIRDVLVSKGRVGWEILAECARDPLVGNLLVLHELHPEPLEARVQAGLGKVETFLRLNRSTVEVLSLGREAIRLRIVSDPAGVRTSPERLRGAVEQALLEAAPDAPSLHIEVMEGPR
ncbi:MAG TPA: hypothetical protein VIG99_33000 [Myxococcaceae bacterium]|jgi:hypothetical protein